MLLKLNSQTTQNEPSNHVRQVNNQKHSLKRKTNKVKAHRNSSKLPTLIAYFGIEAVQCLIDSGSSVNIISESLYNKLVQKNLIRRFQSTHINCLSATGEQIPVKGMATVKIHLENYSWYTNFMVCEKVTWDVILGVEFIKRTEMLVDLSNQEFYFKFDPSKRFSFRKKTF